MYSAIQRHLTIAGGFLDLPSSTAFLMTVGYQTRGDIRTGQPAGGVFFSGLPLCQLLLGRDLVIGKLEPTSRAAPASRRAAPASRLAANKSGFQRSF